jgi:phospholipid/cholesterol/gamma-HCH transport system substrate-binding protein
MQDLVEITELPREPVSLVTERFRFRHVHAITGTFVLLIFAVLIAVLVFAGRSQRWFIGNVTLRIVLPEGGAAGIRQGSEVYFLGTLMGTVADVSVDPAGRMEAEVNIRRDFFLFVRADSSAVVKRKFGVVGDAYFEITRGHGQTLPEKNARIICNEQLPSALESAVEEVRFEAVPALKKLSAALDNWGALGSNLITSRLRLDQLVGRLDDIASDLQQGRGTAGKLITDPALADDAHALMSQGNVTLSELRGAVTNLNTLVQGLQLGTARLPEITEAVANEADDLPGLVAQTQSSMLEFERLVQAMQRHWLLRKYVDKPSPTGTGGGSEGAPGEIRPIPRLRSPRDAGR